MVMRLVIAILVLASGLALSSAGDDGAGRDQEDRRFSPRGLDEAVKRGEIRPLGEVLAAVQARYSGEILAVETEQHGSRWIYEVKILGSDGRRRKIIVDAGSLDSVEE